MDKSIFELEAPIPNFLDEGNADYNSEDVIRDGIFYYYMKQEVYFKAELILVQRELDVSMNFVLWVRVGKEDFIDLSENLKYPYSMVKGRLISDLFLYEHVKDLEISILLNMENGVSIPKIEILDNHFELHNDFKNGIAKDKFVTWKERLEFK